MANAEDVYDALPGGWQGVLDERGRGLSGGQRQRVVLARALGARARSWCWSSPPRRSTPTPRRGSPAAAPPHRRGRTTVVSTVSPLWLHHADRVVLLDGRSRRGRRHPRGAAGATARRTAASSRAR